MASLEKVTFGTIVSTYTTILYVMRTAKLDIRSLHKCRSKLVICTCIHRAQATFEYGAIYYQSLVVQLSTKYVATEF